MATCSATERDDLMAYALDDSWDNCGPVARAGNACFGLYSRCGIWSSRNLTDGFVPVEIAHGYGSPEQAQKLVAVGLWEVVDGGYRAIHYLERNPDAVTVRQRQKAEAERKARWRASRGDGRGSPGVRPGGTPRGTPRSPTTPKGVGGARPAATPHNYVDDGQGCCETCGLIPTNRAHLRAV
jgi:hypothetical protein